VVGIDFDDELVKRHQAMGRKILHGDPSDADFWEKIEKDHNIELVMLALPNLQANLDALEQLRKISFSGRIAATARFPDEVKRLRQSGATAVFNIYTEAGVGFAEHVEVNNQV
jgi:glutathione-regulated potassium-efflux system ancillary protein KefC